MSYWPFEGSFCRSTRRDFYLKDLIGSEELTLTTGSHQKGKDQGHLEHQTPTTERVRLRCIGPHFDDHLFRWEHVSAVERAVLSPDDPHNPDVRVSST